MNALPFALGTSLAGLAVNARSAPVCAVFPLNPKPEVTFCWNCSNCFVLQRITKQDEMRSPAGSVLIVPSNKSKVCLHSRKAA
jgi:hypothetical protein